METPEITLRDHRLDPSIQEQSNLPGRFDVVVSSDRELLIIQDSCVQWFKGGLLNRKLVFEGNVVVNAFFTTLQPTEADSQTSRERALIVVLKDAAYVYSRDGQTHSMSFTFDIEGAFPYEHGVVIDRGVNGTNGNTSFMTLSEPMNELGGIVSSSTSLISSNERLMHFPNGGDSTIAVTLDTFEKTLNLYHTRFLNRSSTTFPKSTATATSNPLGRKQSHSYRRASATTTTTTTTTHDEDMSTGDDIKMNKKRNVSHSDVMSIDRMASLDFNGNTKSTITDHLTSGASYDATMKKDAILSKLQSIPVEDHQFGFKIESLTFDDKETLIIKNDDASFFHCIIFEASKSSVSTPRFIRSQNLSGKFINFGKCALPGVAVLLSTTNEFVLFNPVLQLSTSIFKPSTTITQIFDIFGSQIIAKDSSGHILNYSLPLEPKSELVNRCLKCLRHITNSYTYNYIWITYINAFALVMDEWEAFILTVLLTVLPFAMKPSQLDSLNVVSSLLSKITPLQMKALDDEFSLAEMAPTIVTALHLIREDLKLNLLETGSVNKLGLLLAQLTSWMLWNDSWKLNYGVDDSTLSKTIKFPQPPLLERPPDLLQSLTSLFEDQIIPFCTFSQLAQDDETVDEMVTPRTFAVLKLFEAFVSSDISPTELVRMLGDFKITPDTLETFPIGVLIPLKEITSYCQEHVSSLEQSLEEFDLIDRKDLKMLKSDQKLSSTHQHGLASSRVQTKDISQIVAAIAKPPQHVAPIEEDRLDVTRHIFSSDRRFWEITKLLETSQVQTAMDEDFENLPEEASLMRQKDLATLAYIRTLTMAIGKSIVFYSMKSPLTTEIFPFWKLNFITKIKPENMTVTPDKEAVGNDALQWGYFHNGAANGLTISNQAKGITGSWITFNKTSQFSPQHAGFLLGLGLNGHLKSLEEWNIYNYLGPKHLFTSIGLLLGMSASLKRTMDVKLTRVLSVHVVALLPHGASDLIVSTSVQTAGLIGIGLLYLETQHRRMTEVLLSQITGKVLVEEKEIADESYRLAAGIALGYVNLGKANDLKSLNDTGVVDKLLDIAVSMKDIQSDESYDKSMTGSILALTFIYLKFNDESLAKKLSVPDTDQMLDYVRPDILLLRALAKNLIMWDHIGQSHTWVESQIPLVILKMNSDKLHSSENVTYFYVVSGLCLAIGIKFASTANLQARDTVLEYYDEFTGIIDELHGNQSYEVKISKQALSQAQMCLAIAMSLIMAATGDLEVFRRLRMLHGRFKHLSKDIAYGKFMAVNMSLGFLFLGGGQYAIDTSSNFGIAALVTSIYPLFPNIEPGNSETHLQALRHFWSMSVEPRCLVTRDVESFDIVPADACVEFVDGSAQLIKTPSLLPPLESIETITVDAETYFPVEISGGETLFKDKIDLVLYKKQKIEVMKYSVKLLLSEINAKFEEEKKNVGGIHYKLDILQQFRKRDIQDLFEDVDYDKSVNIIDRQIELLSLVKQPRNVDDLLNLKLIFSYYDRALSEDDTYYLSLEFVDNLKNLLWSAMSV